MKTRALTSAITFTLLSLTLSTAAQTQSITLDQEVSALRPLGSKGLQQFLSKHAQELDKTALPPTPLRNALDSLCKQRDCHASRLYWYTDLEQAKTAAQASGKPILSLRLLGRLDQDLSCANSRFFRVALYSNANISKYLAEHFILHWQSVRPVPKVTIDFGDGRTLERTLTGNSIHYVLAPSGQPIDAIPGLYGPQAFLRQIQQGERVAKTYTQTTARDRQTYLRQYHRDHLNAIQTRWSQELSQLGLSAPKTVSTGALKAGELPRADVAGSLAMTKAVVENPIVSGVLSRNTLTQMTDPSTWTQLGRLHTADAKLDPHSLALMRAKKFQGAISETKTASPVVEFETVMAIDGVRNEYLLHSQIHQWFIQGRSVENVETLNENIYAKLFLTPNTDPWLGLLSSDSYSAIDRDGILKKQNTP
jgi:hypothetical protein